MSEQEASLDEFTDQNTEKLDLGPQSLRLPEQWDDTRFGEVFSHQRGVNYSSDNYVSEGEGMIFLTLNAIAPGGGLKKDSLKFYDDDIPEEKTTTAGDILMANTDLNQDGEIIGYPVRVSSFDSDQKKCFSHHLLKIRQKGDTYNSYFLEYLLSAKFIHDRMIAFSCGSTVLNLNTGLLEKLELPVPPLEEQRKIASVLYTVDQAVQKTEEIIAQMKRVKKGVMQDLFTEGYYNYSQYGETYFGPISVDLPKAWDVENIENISKTVESGETPTGGSKVYVDFGIPFIRSQNVLMNRLDFSDIAYITEEIHENMSRSKVIGGDVLLNITGASIGRVAAVSQSIEEANVNQHVCRIRLSEEIGVIPSFLSYFLSTEWGQKQVSSFQGGSTREGLNYDQVRSIRLPVPEQEEQEKIVKVLSEIDEKISHESKLKSRLECLKQGLMQDLLSGEVRTHDKDIALVDDVLQHG
jgi:type I restriction enzyme S subunit